MDSIYLHYGKYTKPHVMLCIYKKKDKISQYPIDTLYVKPSSRKFFNTYILYFKRKKIKSNQILNSINYN